MNTDQMENRSTDLITHICKSDQLSKSLVAYICDNTLLEEIQKIPNIEYRNKMVAALIQAYRLHPLMKCMKSIPATDEELTCFHSEQYIEYLKTVKEDCDSSESLSEYGLEYDCPPLTNLYEMVCRIAGATLTAVRQLTSKNALVAINWCGGWHHAQRFKHFTISMLKKVVKVKYSSRGFRAHLNCFNIVFRDEAEGFCYVNDIVVGIEELRKTFPRVLYIDFDIHHGNGVQNAYYYTKRVLTLSFHKLEPGFYPTTGDVSERGKGPGTHFCINVPLSQGLTNANLCHLFDKIVNEVEARYKPDAVVLQCGADCLTGDPIGNFNITPPALGYCLKNVLSWRIPTLVLGGGGYNKANTARCWTYLTAIICNTTLSDEIPDNPFFSEYGPGFDLDISPGRIPNLNNDIDQTIASVLENLKNINTEH